MVNAPGGDYILGGDGAGRDVLSRLLYAGRLTLLGAMITVSVAAVIGVTTGLIAGYFGGWFDAVTGWAANLLIVLPGTIVLVTLFSLIGPQVLVSMAVLGVLIAPSFYRLVRNQVIAVKNELYVDAARVSGVGNARIIGRHILYVVRAPIILLCATVAGIAIVVQAGLEFIGLGDPPPPPGAACCRTPSRTSTPADTCWHPRTRHRPHRRIAHPHRQRHPRRPRRRRQPRPTQDKEASTPSATEHVIVRRRQPQRSAADRRPRCRLRAP